MLEARNRAERRILISVVEDINHITGERIQLMNESREAIELLPCDCRWEESQDTGAQGHRGTGVVGYRKRLRVVRGM